MACHTRKAGNTLQSLEKRAKNNTIVHLRTYCTQLRTHTHLLNDAVVGAEPVEGAIQLGHETQEQHYITHCQLTLCATHCRFVTRVRNDKSDSRCDTHRHMSHVKSRPCVLYLLACRISYYALPHTSAMGMGFCDSPLVCQQRDQGAPMFQQSRGTLDWPLSTFTLKPQNPENLNPPGARRRSTHTGQLRCQPT